jgi:hypothetical protein
MEKLSSSLKGKGESGSGGSRLKTLFKRKAKMVGSVGVALRELQRLFFFHIFCFCFATFFHIYITH